MAYPGLKLAATKTCLPAISVLNAYVTATGLWGPEGGTLGFLAYFYSEVTLPLRSQVQAMIPIC